MALEMHRGVNISHWLSQSKRRGAERAGYFTEDDVRLIAELGFDHLRVPIDEEQMWHPDGRQDDEAFDLLDAGLDACLAAGLGAVVDLHILRSHYFNDAETPALWTDPDEPKRFAELWRQLSERLRGRANEHVAYELLNEAVAPTADDWNRVWRFGFDAIRAAEPRRTILLGSNRWNSPSTFEDLAVPDDEHCILTFHFYQPMLITHYTAPWWRAGSFYDGPVCYPGRPVPEEQWAKLSDEQRRALGGANEPFDRGAMARALAGVLAVRERTGRALYCGEFGSWDPVDKVSASIRPAWFADLLSVFARERIAWAVWDYGRGGFGILDAAGRPGPVARALTA